VLLDVYGTDHHPDAWPGPDAVDPSRFVGVEADRFAFVPTAAATSRPAPLRRRLAVELLKGAVQVLDRSGYANVGPA
jgi:fatty-acid peroxygenase